MTAPQHSRETLTQATARRLRGQLAERQISGLRLAALTGMGRSMVDRRLRGETALNTDELALIQDALGICAAYLLTGHKCTEECPQQGSNLRPAD